MNRRKMMWSNMGELQQLNMWGPCQQSVNDARRIPIDFGRQVGVRHWGSSATQALKNSIQKVTPCARSLGSWDSHVIYSVSIYLSIYLYIYLSIYLSIHPSIDRSIHPSIHPSTHACMLHACMHMYMLTHIHSFWMHAYIHTCIHTYVHTCMHICACIFMLLRRSVRQGSEFCPWSISHDQCSRQNTHTYLCIHIYVCHIYHYLHYLSFGGRMFLPLYQTLKTTQGPSSYHAQSLGLQWLAQVACQLLGCDDKVSPFRLFHVRSWTIWWTDTDSFSSDTWIRNTLVSRKP